jgi:hypothetical protein
MGIKALRLELRTSLELCHSELLWDFLSTQNLLSSFSQVIHVIKRVANWELHKEISFQALLLWYNACKFKFVPLGFKGARVKSTLPRSQTRTKLKSVAKLS